MNVDPKRRALGRGLDALLPQVPSPMATGAATSTSGPRSFLCPVERIAPQKGQPRQHFDSAKLDELAQSLVAHGQIEPVVVRPQPGLVDRYEIIAGERRWRAAQRAGLLEIHVVVRDTTSSDAFELALVENAQREDLNAVEFAEAMSRLIREHGYTQERLAERLGKDRTTITNALRLLKLPASVRNMVVEGALTEGHARALLGVSDPTRVELLADRVVRSGLSVRATEKLVRGARTPTAKGGGAAVKSASVRDLETRLSRHLGTRVEVHDEEGKGRVAISYGSLAELDRLLERLLEA